MDSKTWKNMTAEEKRAHRALEDKYDEANRNYHVKRTEQAVAPVIERLPRLGYQVEEIKGLSTLRAEIPAGLIKTVESWTEVWRISLQKNDKQKLNTSRTTIGANTVKSRIGGGAWIKVAVIEPGGRVQRINGINPHLNGIVQDTTFVCGTPSEHTAAVAGIVRSTHANGH